MPIITCPHCETRLNAPDSILGREVVCGRCQKAFTAKADTAVAPAAWAGAPPSPGAGAGAGAPASPPSAGPAGPAAAPPIAPSAPASPRPIAPSSPPAAPRAFSPPPIATPPPPAAPPAYMTPPPPPPPGFPMPQQKTSGFAIASLVLGIASIVLCMCYGVPSLICGILALVFNSNAMRDIHSGAASPDSAGMARAGRICGTIGIVLSVGFWVVFLVAVLAHG